MIPGILQPSGFFGLPSGWSHQFETFPGSDGTTQLFAGIYKNEKTLAAGLRPRVLFVLHGMGEHGGRYVHAAHFLQHEIDILYCLDQRGHGRSEGLRGHVDRFDSLADDLALAIRRLDENISRQSDVAAEIHLWGHSMGGHVALRTLFLHPTLVLKSASVSAPFLAIKQPVPLAKRVGAHLLNHVWAQLQLETGLKLEWLSRDPAVVEAYAKDRLNHGKMTPRFFGEMNAAWKDTLSRNSGINIPLQFLISMADQIVNPEVAIAFFEGLKHSDKRICRYDGFYHEPHNEPGKEAVFADIGSWIHTHTGGASGIP